jgi:nucleotide-binding universal stress UspA family protein
MPLFPHVLIGIDFSPSSEPLLDCLDEFRFLGTERVTLVHVLAVTYPVSPQIEHREEYERKLEEYAERVRKQGLKADVQVRAGAPAAEIVAAAEESGADLILLAAHDHSVVSRLLVGSVASEVLHHATVPVLLDRFTEARNGDAGLCCRHKFERPLLATDGSESASGAEAMAVRLAERGTQVVVLSVIDDRSGVFADEAQAHLDRVAPKNAVVRLESGPRASDVIQRVALVEDATLIIAGKLGRGPITEKLIGSTANRLARKSRLPVLVVPLPAGDRQPGQ